MSATDLVRSLRIDTDGMRHVVESLSAIGSSELGFRNGGTPEDEQVTDFVADRMRSLGLVDVDVEPATVDTWRFRGAAVSIAGGAVLPAASFGGVTGTGPDGVTGRLVDVGDARRSGVDLVDLTGAVVLVDWLDPAVPPAAVGIELARRGAAAILLSCPTGGPWYQAPGAIGAFDGHWATPELPLVTVSVETATLARAAAAVGGLATVHLTVERPNITRGGNVVGYLPGRSDRLLVIGAHHDGWFRGSFDNASGVAALLGLAGAMVGSGHRPELTWCFTSRTAEEYGLADCAYDWCIGAWRQVTETHPDWQERAAFHLCLEASGRPGLRTTIETPPELAGWAARVGGVAELEGWTPTGWRLDPPVTGTEQWPYLVAGVPGVAAYAWEASFGTSEYHTQLDTPAGIDWEVLTAQTRLYALLALDADPDPDAVLDHCARADEVEAALAAVGVDPTRSAPVIAAHRAAEGRAAFSTVGRELLAIDAHDVTGYPFAQAASDVAALQAAVVAFDAGEVAAVVTAIRSVGYCYLADHLSHDSFVAYLLRLAPEAVAASWASASHLSPTVDLWQELASAVGEPGSAPYGPWVGDRLRQALDTARTLLDERVNASLAALRPQDSTQSSGASGSGS